MAAPSKAFIDPTNGALRMLAGLPAEEPVGIADALPISVFRPCSYLPKTNLAPLFICALPTMNSSFVPKVPEPPMGRQATLTFPPVYRSKEDVNKEPTNSGPREYPPIVIKLYKNT